MPNNQAQDEFNYVATLLMKNVDKAKRKAFEQRSDENDQAVLDEIEAKLQF